MLRDIWGKAKISAFCGTVQLRFILAQAKVIQTNLAVMLPRAQSFYMPQAGL